MSSAIPERFEFGEFRLDVGRRALLDGSGRPVELPTKAFDALIYLVQNAGRVVERAELMDALWPRGVVEDNTLSQVVVRLRGAIGEECIVTLKGRGYQFVEQVRSPGTAASPDDGYADPTVNGRSRLGDVGAYQLTAAGVLGLAVLAIGAYWAASRVSDSVTEGRSVPPPISEAGTPRSRAYDFYLSGRNYESRGKADANIELAIRQYRRAVDEDPSLAMAWVQLSVLYSESHFFRKDPSQEHGRLALDAAEKALALDPDLPDAHLAMAFYLVSTPDFLDALDELAAAERGMPDNPIVPWSRGHLYLRAGRFEEALAAYERAVELSPGSVDFHFEPPRVYQLRRDYANAERYYDRILELKPDHVGSQVEKAWLPLRRDGDVTAARAAATRARWDAGDLFYTPPQYFGWLAAFYERDYTAALRYLDVWSDDAWRITLADFVPKASLYGITYHLLGDYERADSSFRIAAVHVEAELGRSPESPELWIALGETRAWLGEGEAARDAAQNALDIVSTSDDYLYRSMIELGAASRVYVPLGDLESAFAGLDRYFSAPGIWSIEGVAADPRFDEIREDPRFVALVERYRRR